MDCTRISRLFPALMAGDLPAADAAAAEEHLQACESCSQDFEAYESRFFGQYEPAGKALAALAAKGLPQEELDRFVEALKARLGGPCVKLAGAFAAYLHGDLEAKSAAELEGHLQGCESCSREFETYETRMYGEYEAAGRALAEARKVTPPESALLGFYNKVQARIHADTRRRKSSVRRGWLVNAAALFIIGVSVSYLFFDFSPESPAPRPVPAGDSPGVAVMPERLGPADPGVRSAAPASTQYNVHNMNQRDAFPGRSRRSGGVQVLGADGVHTLEQVRPVKGTEPVGF